MSLLADAVYTRGCTHDTAAGRALGYRCVRRMATCRGAGATDLRSIARCTNQSIAMQTDSVDNNTHTPEDPIKLPHHNRMPTLDYYGGNVWVYEGVYFMFTHRTWHWSARKYPTTEKIEPGMFAPAIVSAAAPFAPLRLLATKLLRTD